LAVVFLVLAEHSLESQESTKATRDKASKGGVPAVLARTHFLGVTKMQQDTNLEAFVAISRLPETDALRKATFEKLTEFFYHSWRRGTNAANPDAGLLIPLFDDLLFRESHLEIRAGANSTREWSLAIRLPEKVAQLWETNFSNLSLALSSNAPQRVSIEGVSFLKSTSFDARNPVCLTRLGDWLLLSGGSALPSIKYGLFSELKKSGHPNGGGDDVWLDVEFDAAKIGPFSSMAKLLKAGKTHLAMTSRKESLRTEVEMQLTAPNNWKFQPWQVPTNTIKDPLTGFSAMQGFGPLLASQGWFKRLGWEQAPNELFLWTQPVLNFTTFGALQVENATNLMQRTHAQLVSLVTNTLGKHITGHLNYKTNLNALFWEQLPVVIPYIRPAPEPGGNFLEMGLMSYTTNNVPMPQALLDQVIGRTNLIYYDWEITAARLEQWPAINQIVSMATDQTLNPEATAADRWLAKITPKLGNTITELSAISPTEWKLVRRAPIGLSSTELIAFLRWFNHSAFPHLGKEFWFDPAMEGPYLRKTKASHP
jgi:hypothetical protein